MKAKPKSMTLSGYSVLLGNSFCLGILSCLVWVLGNFDCLACQWPTSHASSNSATHKISWNIPCKNKEKKDEKISVVCLQDGGLVVRSGRIYIDKHQYTFNSIEWNLSFEAYTVDTV